MRISRIRGIAQNIPLKNSSLDLVLFPYNGIHCILKRNERKQVLREIAAVLKPGGIFFAEACPGFDKRQDEERKERYDQNIERARQNELNKAEMREALVWISRVDNDYFHIRRLRDKKAKYKKCMEFIEKHTGVYDHDLYSKYGTFPHLHMIEFVRDLAEKSK